MKSKVILFLPFILVLLVGCAGKKKMSSEHINDQEIELSTKETTTQISVIINPEDVPPGKTPEEVLSAKAEKEGMKKIMNKWLNQRFLYQLSTKRPFDSAENEFISHGRDFQAQQDPMTKVYKHRFKIKAEFLPVRQSAGQVVKFPDNRALAGQNDYVTINLFQNIPNKQGAYFLVSREENLEKENLYRVVGSGKMYHSVDNIGQGILMETNHEILKEDFINLLKIEVHPVQISKAPEATEASGPEEVVVKPVQEPEKPEMPKEPK